VTALPKGRAVTPHIGVRTGPTPTSRPGDVEYGTRTPVIDAVVGAAGYELRVKARLDGLRVEVWRGLERVHAAAWPPQESAAA